MPSNRHQVSALGGWPVVNKFEQFSSDHHQMSLTGNPCEVPIQRGLGAWGLGGSLVSEVQCTMGNGHMGFPCGQNDRQMDRHNWKHYQNITFLPLRWWAVTMLLMDWRVMACSFRWSGNEDKKHTNSILTIGQRFDILSKYAKTKAMLIFISCDGKGLCRRTCRWSVRKWSKTLK